MMSLQLEPYRKSAALDSCPFSETKTNICLASLSSMVVGTGSWQYYCSTENHDNCPVFLARMLRKR